MRPQAGPVTEHPRCEYAAVVTPTRPSLLAMLALLAAVIGWCLVQLFDSLAGRTLPVPWSAPATLLLLALCLFIWAVLARPRITRKHGAKPMSPFVAARTAALAMAASRTGALVGGFYVGVAVGFLPVLHNAVAQAGAITAGAAVFAAFLMVLAALWLEHICRIPEGPDGAESESQPLNPPADPEVASRRGL